MGDFIPPEELEKFLFSCNDASAQKGAREAAEKARIQADNIGHRLLSKMGWKEGMVEPVVDTIFPLMVRHFNSLLPFVQLFLELSLVPLSLQPMDSTLAISSLDEP